MRITSTDIAKLAGVSRGTVDRVLNNRGQVSEEVKERILRIANESGYRKNILASNLARIKKLKISVVIPNPESDYFWNAPLEGILATENYIQNYGIELSFHLFDILDNKSFSEAFDKSIREKPNAILVAPVFLKESLLYFQIAEQNRIPVVCINSEVNHKDILCYVGQDSFQCGVLAGRLFDLSPREGKKIIALTLGHTSKNAIHITKKIEGLKEYSHKNNCGFEIIDRVVEDFEDQERMAKLTNDIIDDRDDIYGIFFTNSRAYKLLENNSLFKDNTEGLCVIGFDLMDKNIQLLNDGRINFLLNQNPKKQGYLGIINLFNYFIYNKEIPNKIYLSIDIVVKENYLQYIEEEEFINEAFV